MVTGNPFVAGSFARIVSDNHRPPAPERMHEHPRSGGITFTRGQYEQATSSGDRIRSTAAGSDSVQPFDRTRAVTHGKSTGHGRCRAPGHYPAYNSGSCTPDTSSEPEAEGEVLAIRMQRAG